MRAGSERSPSRPRGLLAGAALVLAACGGEETEPDAFRPDEIPAGATDAEVLDALQDLGYVGETEPVGEDGVVVLDRERMQPGYTLFAYQAMARAELIDEEGRVVRRWEDAGAARWENIELLENGDLLTTGADAVRDDEALFALRMRWSGEVVWKRHLTSHHDLSRAPSGDLVTLTYERRSLPEVHPTVDVRDDHVTRLDASDGTVLQSVSLYDLARARPELYPLRPKAPTRRFGWVDLFHCNSVEWMSRPELEDRHPLYDSDNVLFSSRHQDLVAVVDMRRERLVWSWGRGELSGPHDASVLPGGNLLIFDNGLLRGWSRVVELDPVEERIVWQFRYPEDAERPRDDPDKRFHSRTKGSCQRLANGNTLICNADPGELFEVTPEGEVVWRYVSEGRVEKDGRSLRASFVRAYRYERAFIDRLLAGGRSGSGAAGGESPAGAAD